MIFNVPGHIQMIRNGLNYITPASVLYHPMPLRIIKTQARRPKRGIYQIEAKRKNPHMIGYAVQLKRGAKAEPGMRIVMDRIWEERKTSPYGILFVIGSQAWAEGGYTSEQFEKLFRALNPKWDGHSRWAFEFHVIEVRKQ